MSVLIGIDLAWRNVKNPSGIAVMLDNDNSAELVSVSGPLIGEEAILGFIDRHSATHTTIAIDAPLVMRTKKGSVLVKPLLGKATGGLTLHAIHRTYRCIQTQQANLLQKRWNPESSAMRLTQIEAAHG